jgi:hypothetical protein
MSAVTVSALALVCLLIFFVVETQPKKAVSLLDLAEFKELPAELRTALKSVMPSSSMLKKQWASMSPQQKNGAVQQIMSQIPKPPGPPPPPAPSVVIKPPAPGLKPGFLLPHGVNKGKKKDAKDEKEDQVVTLSDIGASEDDNVPVVDQGWDSD